MYNFTPSIFMISYSICTLSLYRFHENTTTIPGISPAIFGITATVSVSSQGWHTHLYRRIALLMTSQQVCKSSHLAHVWHHTQSTSHHIHTIWHERSCFMTSDTRNSWHQIFSLWHHIHSLGHHTTLCMTSSPQYLSSRPLHLCHHTKPIDDITATTWKVLHAEYLWYHIPYVFDKISTKCDIMTLCVYVTTIGICLTSSALQMTLHPLYHTKQRSLWCHIHITHHITPLYQRLHPLYLCHHNLSTDITPTFEWHHTHLLCDILCPI